MRRISSMVFLGCLVQFSVLVVETRGFQVAPDTGMDRQVVRGRVVEAASGAPVEGATVALLEPEGVVARTGEDGRFGLDLPWEAGAVLVVRAPRMATALVEVPAAADGGPGPLTIALEPAGTVELALETPRAEEATRWTGEPRVWVPGEGFRPLGDGPAAARLWRRHPGPDGVLRWEDLGAGVYAFELWDSRGGSVGLPALAVVAPGSFDRFDLPVGTVLLRGTIRGPHPGVGELTGVVLHEPGYAGAVMARIQPAGPDGETVAFRAEVAAARPQLVTVDLAGEGWTAALPVGVVDPGDGEDEEPVELEMETAWLEGMVVDPAGSPVPGATVHVSDAGRSVGCTAQAREDGSWRCPVPGDRPLTVLARHGTVGVTGVVTAPPAGTMAPLVLHPGRSLSGCLRVPEGYSPGGAVVALRPVRHQGFSLRTTTDGEGGFVFENLPPGELGILALPADRDLSVAFAEVGAEDEGELECLEATPAGLAVAPGVRRGRDDGWELRGSPVLDGVEMGDLFLSPGRGGLCGAPEAGCLLVRLPEGRYRYRWRDTAGRIAAETRPFTVYAGELTVFSTRPR